jgi:hypothetical protein
MTDKRLILRKSLWFGHQILHAIGSGANRHNAATQCRDALLELDATVHWDEGIILAVHSAQQLVVLDPGPAAPETVCTA